MAAGGDKHLPTLLSFWPLGHSCCPHCWSAVPTRSASSSSPAPALRGLFPSSPWQEEALGKSSSQLSTGIQVQENTQVHTPHTRLVDTETGQPHLSCPCCLLRPLVSPNDLEPFTPRPSPSLTRGAAPQLLSFPWKPPSSQPPSLCVWLPVTPHLCTLQPSWCGTCRVVISTLLLPWVLVPAGASQLLLAGSSFRLKPPCFTIQI